MIQLSFLKRNTPAIHENDVTSRTFQQDYFKNINNLYTLQPLMTLLFDIFR